MTNFRLITSILAATALPAAAAPLTVQDAVTRALANNPELRAAGFERDVALSEAARNRPAFRPEVTASVGQQIRGPKLTFPGRNDDVTVLPRTRTGLAIEVEQPLYRFGVGKSPSQRADAMEEAAAQTYRAAELDLTRDVRRAYYTYLQAIAGAQVAERAVTLAEEQVRFTKLQKEAGRLADVDVLESERGLAEAQAALAQARGGVELSRANLNRLMGEPVGDPVEAGPPPADPADPAPTAELLPRALAQRPEVLNLRARLREAEAGVKLARSARLPEVRFEGGYALQTPSAFVPRSSYSAAVVVTAPILESANTRRQVEQAGLRVEQLQAAIQAREQGVALEIEQARTALLSARERVRVAERTVTAAREVVRITRLQFELFRATQLQMEAARLSLARAEGDRERARFDVLQAQADLDRALGAAP